MTQTADFLTDACRMLQMERQLRVSSKREAVDRHIILDRGIAVSAKLLGGCFAITRHATDR
jgi:hypothetical protein